MLFTSKHCYVINAIHCVIFFILAVKTLETLTKGGKDSVKLGFGKFVDKVQSPMTQMTEYK